MPKTTAKNIIIALSGSSKMRLNMYIAIINPTKINSVNTFTSLPFLNKFYQNIYRFTGLFFNVII